MSSDIEIRHARREDLPSIVALLADDPLGRTRETPDDLSPYLAAFDRISSDAANVLIVADRAGAVVGVLQLTIIPGVARAGATRSIIEGVRVAGTERGSGLGTRLIEWAVEESRVRDVSLVQLTSDASRTDAHRFYERLGFEPSHLGFKLKL